MAEKLHGMAAIAKGIVGTFDKNTEVLLKVGNCELLRNNDGKYLAVLNPTNNSFAGFYRTSSDAEILQAAHDFVAYGMEVFNKQHPVTPWKPRKT